MKTTLTLIALFLFSSIVFAQTTAILDANFEQALIDLGYDTGTPDGVVSTNNINTTTYLDVSNKNISNLSGIEDFISLKNLICSKNSLTSLDVSNNLFLEYLDCENNLLDSVNVSSNTGLTNLSCGYNLLNSIDISNNVNLETVNCRNNNLTEINVSNNTLLINFWCHENDLTSLDLTNNTLLEYLNFSLNNISQIDISQNVLLESIGCGYNNLSNIDVSHNLNLLVLFCESNQLTTLDLSNNLLSILYCPSNNLTYLDLSNQTSLFRLYCANNQLNFLNVRNGNNLNMDILQSYGNPNLNCVIVDDPWYSYTNWTTINFKKDEWVQYVNEPCGNNIISGTAFVDENINCTKETEEIGMRNIIVRADGDKDYYTSTDDDGNYKMYVDSNSSYQVNAVAFTHLNTLNSSCPENGYSLNSGVDGFVHDSINFGLDVKQCALLSVDISKARMRRCFRNTTDISYRNEGTMEAVNAKIYVDYPDYVQLVYASKEYSVFDAAENIYLFNLDTVDAFSQGSIHIIDSVICGNEEIRGYTQCIKARITPKSYCAETVDTTNWDRSSIVVSDDVECMGDTIARFTITNAGDGDMETTHEYRIYYNNELVYTGSFQLESGESLQIDVPADGSTIRLEADQHPLHPGNSHPRATIEGCGSETSAEAALGYWTQVANDDLDFDVSEVCLEIRDSYDPNDKKVTPVGITENNYVSEDGALNYTIRFQNTGSDVAYNIIVVDTLSEQHDISTLHIIGASHSYEYNVNGTNLKVLSFTFNNINLPDSTLNEPESHGFVSFRISPIDGIIPNTSIDNFADIYFDFNSAVRTDTATITALDTIIVSDQIITVTETYISGIPDNELLDIRVFPNPTNDFIIIEGANDEFNQIRVYDIKGTLIINQKLTSNQKMVNVKSLVSGTYFIHLLNEKEAKYSFKMIKF